MKDNVLEYHKQTIAAARKWIRRGFVYSHWLAIVDLVDEVQRLRLLEAEYQAEARQRLEDEPGYNKLGR